MCNVIFFNFISNINLFRKVYASWVKGTNLLLVVIKQGTRSQCYDSNHCAMSVPPRLSFGFEAIGGLIDNLFVSTNVGDGYEGEIPVEKSISSQEDNQGEDDPDLFRNTNCPAPGSAAAAQRQRRKNIIQCLRDDYLEVEYFFNKIII